MAGWTEWTELLSTLDSRARAVIERSLRGSLAARTEEQTGDAGPATEAQTAAVVLERLEADHVLCVGNSLAIRLAEGVALGRCESRILHQRGLNGIDGLISGVAGSLTEIADLEGEPATARLLIGDVALLHDATGLQLLRSPACRNLDIVVIDNGGGRIFDRLPVADTGIDAAVADLFATPPQVDYAHLAAAFGVGYVEAGSVAQLDAVLGVSNREPGPRLVHVHAKPGGEASEHRRLVQQLDQVISEVSQRS